MLDKIDGVSIALMVGIGAVLVLLGMYTEVLGAVPAPNFRGLSR